MTDVLAAVVWVALFLIIGVVVAVGLIMRARTAIARAQADADLQQRYQQLAERAIDSQQGVEARLEELTQRVVAIEKLLKDVG